MTTGLATNRIIWLRSVLPGVTLCLAVAFLAERLAPAEVALTGRPFIDPVVLAILLGTSFRFVWQPGPAWQQGITCSAKILLECSVVLLGVSIDATTLSRLGPTTILSVGVLVVAAVAGSFAFDAPVACLSGYRSWSPAETRFAGTRRLAPSRL